MCVQKTVERTSFPRPRPTHERQTQNDTFVFLGVSRNRLVTAHAVGDNWKSRVARTRVLQHALRSRGFQKIQVVLDLPAPVPIPSLTKTASATGSLQPGRSMCTAWRWVVEIGVCVRKSTRRKRYRRRRPMPARCVMDASRLPPAKLAFPLRRL